MDHLLEAVEQAVHQTNDSFTYLNWRLTKIYGGMNGLTYRVDDAHLPDHPLAVKLRKRDERHRAQREFSALQALQSLPTPVAPKPISLHLNKDDLPGDVVVAGWIHGEVLGDLGIASLTRWESILVTMSAVHTLQPADAPNLVDAVLPIRSIHDVIAEIEKRWARLPDGQLGEITKAEIGGLVEEFKAHSMQQSHQPSQIGLIICDTNPSNMIDHNGQIFIVDWENSGWADPAFDVADLLVRPQCADLTSDTRSWVLNRYAELMRSPAIPERILAYERLMLIFWLILTSNGFAVDNVQRLAGARSFTLEQTTRQQISYLQRIERARSG